MDSAKIVQRKLCEAQGALSHRAYARKLGVSIGTLARLKSSPQNATLRTLQTICRALRVSLGDFFDERNDSHIVRKQR